MAILNYRTAQAKNLEAVAEIATRTAFAGPMVLFPAGLVTTGAGLWLVLEVDAWSFSNAFVLYGLIISVGVLALFGAYLVPQLRRILDMLDASAPPPEIVAVAARVGRVSQIQTVVLASVIAAMVFKW